MWNQTDKHSQDKLVGYEFCSNGCHVTCFVSCVRYHNPWCEHSVDWARWIRQLLPDQAYVYSNCTLLSLTYPCLVMRLTFSDVAGSLPVHVSVPEWPNWLLWIDGSSFLTHQLNTKIWPRFVAQLIKLLPFIQILVKYYVWSPSSSASDGARCEYTIASEDGPSTPTCHLPRRLLWLFSPCL